MTCWQKNFENRRSLSQENNIKVDVNQSQHPEFSKDAYI